MTSMQEVTMAKLEKVENPKALKVLIRGLEVEKKKWQAKATDDIDNASGAASSGGTTLEETNELAVLKTRVIQLVDEVQVWKAKAAKTETQVCIFYLF
jgi:hypothetical protein